MRNLRPTTTNQHRYLGLFTTSNSIFSVLRVFSNKGAISIKSAGGAAIGAENRGIFASFWSFYILFFWVKSRIWPLALLVYASYFNLLGLSLSNIQGLARYDGK